ncbi:MAG: 16S rRNA (adenine(1518)-N(6)/adenine(1519)-N(6))-dimethyltransferase RsmA [Patescibacteria group bacterium]|nr:16S rRNA (adenine(1518)-N(6)/adenine(1519)-N(6))-dimethyltransferase RsmA [Patescibacteria group bacterium]
MIKAKKSLGQNFLKSKSVLGKIIKAADLEKTDTILEIGPGKGFLTEELLKTAKKVIAVEKDQRLLGLLEEKFKEEIKNSQLKLIYGDILEINPQDLLNLPYKIIANIPYYITGQFLRKFLSSGLQPIKIVVMLQKEVAKRITTTQEKESILSLSVKVYGQPKYIATVSAKNFSPQPKVDSAILSIDNISKKFFQTADENLFFNLIKKGFSSKRKMLINNLSLIPKTELEQIFRDLKIPLKTRAEDLSARDWKKLFDNLENKKVIHK